MLIRIFCFLFGFGITIIGFVYIISYLNLLALGYNFLEYVNFISRRFECLCALFGGVMMSLAINVTRRKKK